MSDTELLERKVDEPEWQDHPIMPNDRFILDGAFATAVASVYLDDETMLGLVMYEKAPFFGLIWANRGYVLRIGQRHSNIVPAVREYEDEGGDY